MSLSIQKTLTPISHPPHSLGTLVCKNDLVRVKHSENALLHSIVSGDLNLLRSNQQSWCKDLHDVLTGTQGCEWQAALMSSRKVMNVEVCKAKYMEAMYEPWTACVGSPRDPRARHGKLLTYHAWFGVDMSESVNKGVRPPLPRNLVVCENPNVVRSMARFRTSSPYLRVETGRFSGVRYPQRVCEHCGMGVEDEWHAASQRLHLQWAPQGCARSGSVHGHG